MTQHPNSTCASCRFINYTRVAGEQPRDLMCSNPELGQRHEVDANLFAEGPFRPPNLAFSCNRFAERAPDIGMVPVHLAHPEDARQSAIAEYERLTRETWRPAPEFRSARQC